MKNDVLKLTDEEIEAISGGKVIDGVYEKIDKLLTTVVSPEADKEYYVDFILHRLLFSDRTGDAEYLKDVEIVKQYIRTKWDSLLLEQQ